MKRKGDIDNYIASNTKVPLYVVRMVTRTWVDGIQRALVENGSVAIDGFGTLKVTVTRARKDSKVPTRTRGSKNITIVKMDVPEQVHVHFRKAKQLSLALKADKEASHGTGRRNGQVRSR